MLHNTSTATTLTNTRVQPEETKGKLKGSSLCLWSPDKNKQDPHLSHRDSSQELLGNTSANTLEPGNIGQELSVISTLINEWSDKGNRQTRRKDVMN